VKEMYDRNHYNIVEISPTATELDIANALLDQTRDYLKRKQTYLVQIAQGMKNLNSSYTSIDLPARIYDLGITPEDFKNHFSEFKTYCPVTFVKEGYLVNMERDRVHQFGIEYKNKIYSMSNEVKMKEFIKQPEMFTEKENTFPKKLPLEHIDEKEDDDTEHLYEYIGFDPVYLKQKPYETPLLFTLLESKLFCGEQTNMQSNTLGNCIEWNA
jgi:hypothetical protein